MLSFEEGIMVTNSLDVEELDKSNSEVGFFESILCFSRCFRGNGDSFEEFMLRCWRIIA